MILRGLACCNRVRLIKELDGKDWRLLVDCGPPRVKALEAWEKHTSAAQAGYGSVSYSTAEAVPFLKTDFSRRHLVPDYSRTGNGLTAPARVRGLTHIGMASSGMGFEVKNFRV